MAPVGGEDVAGCFGGGVAAAGDGTAHGVVACPVFLVLFLFGLLAEV